jgi:hypothetical protein
MRGEPGPTRDSGDVARSKAPELGPVDLIGYHVMVVETSGAALPQLDIDVETTVIVPAASQLEHILPRQVQRLRLSRR